MDRMHQLVELINAYNEAYYGRNESMVSDNVYDQLLKELIALESANPESRLDNSPTNRVAGNADRIFTKRVHERAMLSLTNAFSKEEILEKINELERLTAEQKALLPENESAHVFSTKLWDSDAGLIQPDLIDR